MKQCGNWTWKPLPCFTDVTTLLALACTDIPRCLSSPSTSAAVTHFSMFFFSLFEKVFLFYCFQNASLIAILTIKVLTMLLLYTGRSCSKCLFQFVLIRFAVFVFVLSPFSVSSPSLRERDGEALVSRRICRCDVPQKGGWEGMPLCVDIATSG